MGMEDYLDGIETGITKTCDASSRTLSEDVWFVSQTKEANPQFLDDDILALKSRVSGVEFKIGDIVLNPVEKTTIISFERQAHGCCHIWKWQGGFGVNCEDGSNCAISIVKKSLNANKRNSAISW